MNDPPYLLSPLHLLASKTNRMVTPAQVRAQACDGQQQCCRAGGVRGCAVALSCMSPLILASRALFIIFKAQDAQPWGKYGGWRRRHVHKPDNRGNFDSHISEIADRHSLVMYICAHTRCLTLPIAIAFLLITASAASVEHC